MKKWMLGLGLILILVGVGMAYNYNANNERVREVQVAYELKAWSVSSEFAKEDKIVLDTPTPGVEWSVGAFDEGPEGGAFLYVYINFQDPRGNITKFEVPYVCTEQAKLYAWPGIQVIRNDGGLDVSLLYNETWKAYFGIGGIVQYDGTYTVTIVGIEPPRENPPESLRLYKGEIITEYPYATWLPIGIGVGAVGAFLSASGLIIGRRKRVQNSIKKRGAKSKKP